MKSVWTFWYGVQIKWGIIEGLSWYSTTHSE